VEYEPSRAQIRAAAILDRFAAFLSSRGLPVQLSPKDWSEPWLVEGEGVDGFKALGAQGSVAIPRLARHLTNGPFHAGAAFALAAIGQDAVPALVAALKCEFDQARYGAVMALGDLGAKAKPAVPALLALWDREPALREIIGQQLKFIDEPSALKLAASSDVAPPGNPSKPVPEPIAHPRNGVRPD
jgi:hypothetical protein